MLLVRVLLVSDGEESHVAVSSTETRNRSLSRQPPDLYLLSQGVSAAFHGQNVLVCILTDIFILTMRQFFQEHYWKL